MEEQCCAIQTRCLYIENLLYKQYYQIFFRVSYKEIINLFLCLPFEKELDAIKIY